MAEYDQRPSVRRDAPSEREQSKRALAQWRERGFRDAKKNLPPPSRAHLIEHGGEDAPAAYLRGHRLGKANR